MKVRLESMSKKHCLFFISALLIVIAAFFIASFETGKMFEYYNGDINSCPTLYTNGSNKSTSGS